MEPRAQRMVLFGRRMVFGGLEPVLSEEEKTFQGLQEAGAFQESLNVSETLTLMISVWIPISKNC